jgi:tripartite-type tricarboxylate transporter receptor subunit TctC
MGGSIDMRIGNAAAAFLALALMPSQAVAQEGAAFFDGKTITYIVATDPGGGYDTNGRLVAEYMQKYLPGSTIVVQNMPGAGHLIGTNYIYASEPDGLTIGTFNTGLIYGQMVGDPAAKFDFTKMSWIGKVSSDPRVVVVSTESGIESFEQLAASTETVKFAAAGRGSAATVETGMLAKTLNLPIQIIDGYGGNEDQLAMRRGEVKGVIGFRSTWEKFIAEGHGKFIAQIGGSQTDVPQLSTFATTDESKKVIALIESQAKIARLTAGPPDIPEDRYKALVEAYAKATSDPEFVAKAKSLKLPVEPAAGQPVADAVQAAMQLPPDLQNFLKDMMKKE